MDCYLYLNGLLICTHLYNEYTIIKTQGGNTPAPLWGACYPPENPDDCYATLLRSYARSLIYNTPDGVAV